jgi:hypothetical protein
MGVFVGFSRIFLGILIFKGLTGRRLYKSFGVKGLTYDGRFTCEIKSMIVTTKAAFNKQRAFEITQWV